MNPARSAPGPRKPADTFGSRLTAERTAKGLSKSELARRTGLSDGHIGSIERGDFRPKSDAITALVDALGLPGSWVLTGDEVPSPDERVLVKLTPSEWDVVRAIGFLTDADSEAVIALELGRALLESASKPDVASALAALELHRAHEA